jgi:hypothetical protein
MARHEHGHDHDHRHVHVPGTMDITQHERTFNGFVKWCMWVVIVSIVVLIFLALVNA